MVKAFFSHIFILTLLPILALFCGPPSYAEGGDRATARRKIQVGFEVDFAPYSTVNKDGKATGFSTELLYAVARHAGLEIVPRVATWNQIRSDLEEGRIDALAFMAKSAVRAAKVDFSDPHTITYDGVFIRKGDDRIQSEEDLTGKRIAVLAGDTADDYLRRNGMTVVSSNTLTEAFKNLELGSADAVVASQIVGLSTLQSLNSQSIVLAPKPLIHAYSREFAFAVKKGEGELLNLLNEGLKAVIASGEYRQLYDKWLLNLDPELKRQRDNFRRLIWVLLITLVTSAGLVGLVVIFKRQLRRSVRELAQSEMRYKTLIANMPGAIFRCRLEHGHWQLDFISSGIEEISGYKAEEMLRDPHSIIGVIDAHDLERARQNIEDWTTRSGRQETEFCVRAKDQSLRWIHACWTMIPNQEGKPSSIDGVLVDFTEQKLVRDLLTEQQSKMAASARLSALGEMAGGIAHEINNPLAIIGLRTAQIAQLARRGELKSDAILEIAGGIESTTHRISRIIRSLQAVARDSKDDPFEESTVQSIFDETFELCYQRIRKNGVDIVAEPIPPALSIICRRGQVAQVLINLLNNAFDAVLPMRQRFIRITVTDLVDSIEIAVLDSGKGINPELRQKIFQPFFTTKSLGQGTGLGLSISRGLIEGHGGTLELDTMATHTCFVIHLPKYPAIAEQHLDT